MKLSDSICKRALVLFAMAAFLTGCDGGQRVGDIYKNGDIKGIVVSVNSEGQPTMILSTDEAVALNADSALIWASKLQSDNGTEWTLPTKEEMVLLKKYKSLINNTLRNNKLPLFLENGTFYWTSTPCSESHCNACGPDGVRCYFKKNDTYSYRARGVMRIESKQ